MISIMIEHLKNKNITYHRVLVMMATAMWSGSIATWVGAEGGSSCGCGCRVAVWLSSRLQSSLSILNRKC
jgi:hypothetical protein